MGRIKKHKPHRVRRPASPPSSATAQEVEIAKMFRSRCDNCGSTKLDWFETSEATQRLGDEARRALDWLGSNDAQGAVFWQCGSCGNFGALGATHLGR